MGAFVHQDQSVYFHRTSHSRELGGCLCPESYGMARWSLCIVDSHTGWHAKDLDRLCSPADGVTAAFTHPKPGLVFVRCRWARCGAYCTRLSSCISTVTLKTKGRHLYSGVDTVALGGDNPVGHLTSRAAAWVS